MRVAALLLDIDGTLVDNTAQHIAAWRDAFAQLGHPVDDETLRQNIGKGGDLFVAAVAGGASDREYGDQCRELHRTGYQRRLSEVRPVPFVHEFLQGARDRGIRLTLATSSSPDEVKANLAVFGEAPEHFEIVDKDQVETSKPAPDVFAVALKRSEVSKGEAVAVGDTRWDGEAASKISVRFWGVLTGAGREDDLRAGGAEHICPHLKAVLKLL